MKQEALSQFPVLWLMILANFIFIAFFIGVLNFVGRRRNKPLFNHAGNMPLNDGVLEEGENNE